MTKLAIFQDHLCGKDFRSFQEEMHFWTILETIISRTVFWMQIRVKIAFFHNLFCIRDSYKFFMRNLLLENFGNYHLRYNILRMQISGKCLLSMKTYYHSELCQTKRCQEQLFLEQNNEKKFHCQISYVYPPSKSKLPRVLSANVILVTSANSTRLADEDDVGRDVTDALGAPGCRRGVPIRTIESIWRRPSWMFFFSCGIWVAKSQRDAVSAGL